MLDRTSQSTLKILAYFGQQVQGTHTVRALDLHNIMLVYDMDVYWE